MCKISKIFVRKMRKRKYTAYNKRFGAIAGVTPQKV